MMNEFETVTENDQLKEAIVQRIQSQGPIPFRDFMEMALYQPRHGYYASPREKMGREGDYLTSPEVSPLFGTMLGRQLHEMWEAMERPPSFDVVEMGAGSGTLCRDLTRWARRVRPEFAAAVAYTIIEVSEALIERQRRTMGDGAGSVSWSQTLPEAIEGCLLSNELVDSFPVHRVTVEEGRLREIFVGWDGRRFVEELRPPSTGEIETYFQRLGLLPGEGCRAEVNLQALRWMSDAGRALRRGFVLTFDYGHEAADLYAPWRRDGTLLCFYRHNPSGDPYARLGRQDMTSQVDLTSLRRAGEEAGLRVLGLVPQSQFLARLGIGEALAPPGESDLNLEEYYARRRAVLELVDPAGLGRIRALAQAKGIDDCRLTGLEAAEA